MHGVCIERENTIIYIVHEFILNDIYARECVCVYVCVCRGLLDLEVDYGAIVQSLPTSNNAHSQVREKDLLCVCVEAHSSVR